MNDAELRALVRDAVQRHLGHAAPAGAPSSVSPCASAAPPVPAAARPAPHTSHYQYVALINAGDACVIEPAVNCDHCGYCRSHGH